MDAIEVNRRIDLIAEMVGQKRPTLEEMCHQSPTLSVTEGSPCEELDHQVRGIPSLSDAAIVASMSPASIVALCRQHLSQSFYTEFGEPSVSTYDRALRCFLWAFANTAGESQEPHGMPSAALAGHWMGVWSRSYLDALQSNDLALAARCAAAASFYMCCLILGSKSCWDNKDSAGE